MLRIDPRALQRALLASYGELTRHEAGIELKGMTWRCVPPASIDTRVLIEGAAERVATRLASYRAAVLPHYLLLYMDVLLSKVGGKGDAPTVLGRMIEWVHTCGDAWLFAT